MFEVDRIAAIIKPTAKMLEWLKNCSAKQEHLTLQNLRKDCIVLLIPDFEGPRQSSEYIKKVYSAIFKAELLSWQIDENLWPEDRNFDLFRDWFDVEFHSLVYDVAYLEELHKIESD